MTPSAPALLYRDDRLLAVDKPSGMLVHRGWARDDVVLTDLVRATTGRPVVHPLHRLDRGTSGVVLFALDADAARTLRERFGTGAIEKTYLAVVRGVPPTEGEVESPLPRDEGGPRVPARTIFRRLAVAEVEPRTVSLVVARPVTGRLHQVRRHLKHAGHPVLGDANYGRGDLNRAFAATHGLARLALHAASLALDHPATGDRLVIDAPLPPDLAAFVARLFGPLAPLGD